MHLNYKSLTYFCFYLRFYRSISLASLHHPHHYCVWKYLTFENNQTSLVVSTSDPKKKPYPSVHLTQKKPYPSVHLTQKKGIETVHCYPAFVVVAHVCSTISSTSLAQGMRSNDQKLKSSKAQKLIQTRVRMPFIATRAIVKGRQSWNLSRASQFSLTF